MHTIAMKPTILDCAASNESVEGMFAHKEAFDDRSIPSTRSWKPLRDLLVGAVLSAVAAVAVFGLLAPMRHQRMQSGCLSNLRQIALGMKQYVRDYDEKFPLVYTDHDHSGAFDSVREIGWGQILQPYMKNEWILQCPAEPNEPDFRDSKQADYCDYFYNARLAAVGESRIDYVSNVICFGDNKTGSAANWVSPARSLDREAAMRHFRGANYAYVDGHVKWLQPSRISGEIARPETSSLCFGWPKPIPAPKAR